CWPTWSPWCNAAWWSTGPRPSRSAHEGVGPGPGVPARVAGGAPAAAAGGAWDLRPGRAHRTHVAHPGGASAGTQPDPVDRGRPGTPAAPSLPGRDALLHALLLRSLPAAGDDRGRDRRPGAYQRLREVRRDGGSGGDGGAGVGPLRQLG